MLVRLGGLVCLIVFNKLRKLKFTCLWQRLRRPGLVLQLKKSAQKGNFEIASDNWIKNLFVVLHILGILKSCQKKLCKGIEPWNGKYLKEFYCIRILDF